MGAIDQTTLVQKGQLPFVEAARLLPDVRFTFAGKWLDDSVDELRARAGENVSSPGWLSDEDLHAAYRRAAVYVQASRHEGFGLAVAEAMLAGCVPVVMNVTAMPEVVGDAGVLIESQEPDEVAGGVSARARARPGRGAPRARADPHRVPDGAPPRRDPSGRGGCARCVTGSPARPPPRWRRRSPAVVIGAGLFGFAIAELTSDDSGTSPGTEAPAVVGGSTQDNGSVPTWPPDLSAYTVVIAGHPIGPPRSLPRRTPAEPVSTRGSWRRRGTASRPGRPGRVARLQRNLRRTRRRAGPREAARGALPGRARRARSELPVAAGHLDRVLRERVARHLWRQARPVRAPAIVSTTESASAWRS